MGGQDATPSQYIPADYKQDASPPSAYSLIIGGQDAGHST